MFSLLSGTVFEMLLRFFALTLSNGRRCFQGLTPKGSKRAQADVIL
jgi:hypothetical protein